jgi:signal transduction histidine kinase
MAIEPLDLLKRVFPSLPLSDLAELLKLARLRSYPANTVLCAEGAYEKVLYLLSEGQAVVKKQLGNSDDELILRYAGPGDYFGEMAIISDAPRSATVALVEDSTVLELDQAAFQAVLSTNVELALQMVRQTFERLRQNDRMTIGELHKAYETLEKLDKAKLDFIEVTAHELRTPLTIMRGYASMMLADPVIKENPVLREMAEGIVSGSSRLHEIVNNMLDVQRIDLDQMRVAAVPVSLPVVLRGVEMQFKSALDARKIKLVMEIEPGGGATYIDADPGLISKALYHIVMNAIKYTPDGGSITARLNYEGHGDSQVAHIQIADSGIGIDPEHHQLIFEKFYRLGDVQLHSSGKTAFKAGGPGLGLAIAAGAVRAHGGLIWVESAGLDEKKLPGSTFHIILPVKADIRLKKEGLIAGVK